MASSEVEKVLTVLRGIDSGNPDLATSGINPKHYKEHCPLRADGLAGLTEEIAQLSRGEHRLAVVRAFQDGNYVFTHSQGLVLGRGVFFDIFRIEESLIVEHWVFSTESAPPNRSGHTQTDGPTQAEDATRTERNKSTVRNYYEAVHVSGDHNKISQYFEGDFCIRHEPGVRDGVANFKRDLEELVKHRSIDEIRFVLGQGNFVFIAAKGTVRNEPCVYLDLYRVAEDKIVERWGFPQEIPPEEQWRNNNGML